jgi:alpha-tubulin suppressor-like RCC1 family protein
LEDAPLRRLKLTLAVIALVGPCASAQAQTLRVWGTDANRQISGAPEGRFKALGAGGAFQAVALAINGEAVLWGGDGDPVAISPLSSRFKNEKFRAVDEGRTQAVLIRRDWTLAVWNANHPLIGQPPSGRFRAVACGNNHAVAIAADGTLRAWGTGDVLLNVPQGGPFQDVRAHTLSSLALREDGTLFGWGVGARGIDIFRGAASATSPPQTAPWTPTPEDPENFYLPGETFTTIGIGNDHALAVRSDGTVKGWGRIAGGALDAPPHVRFVAVGAGAGYSVGISTDGILWGWGTPAASPFPPPPTRVPAPTQSWSFASVGWTRHGDTPFYYVPDERFRAVGASAFHVAAITDDEEDLEGADAD